MDAESILDHIRVAALKREREYIRATIVMTSLGISLMVLGIAFENYWVAWGSISVFAVFTGSNIYHLLQVRKNRKIIDEAIAARGKNRGGS